MAICEVVSRAPVYVCMCVDFKVVANKTESDVWKNWETTIGKKVEKGTKLQYELYLI